MTTANPRHPYVVVRHMAAVYEKRPLPADWTREETVARVLSEVLRTGRRMCCVFGPADCVYCEPDGTTRASDDPPAGGALLTAHGVENHSL